MDLFVETQLTLCNCVKYIPLFKNKGYDEDKYRNLRLSSLVKLIPEDDEESIDRICGNILNLRSNDGVNSSSTTTTNKTAVKVEPTNENDDDVQIIKVVNPTPEMILASAPASVKLECSDEIEPFAREHHEAPMYNASAVDEHPGQRQQEVILKIEGGIDNHDGDNVSSLPTEVESVVAQIEEGNTTTEMKEASTGVTPINSNRDKDMIDAVCVDNGSNERMKLRKRRTPTPMVEPSESLLSGSTSGQKAAKRAKKSKSILPSPNISLTYQRSNVTHSLSGINMATVVGIDGKHSKLELCFEFTKLNQLTSFLQELLIHGSELKNMHKLKLLGLSKDVYVGQSELLQLLCITPSFFGQLKSLVLGFGFSDEIDPRCITQLLSLCTNLQIFKVRRGIFGPCKTPESLISIHIPAIPKLTTIRWEKNYGVKEFKFPRAPIEVNLEAPEPDVFLHAIEFELNFSNNQFTNLKELTLGRHPLISFQHFTQFPQLEDFNIASPWLQFNLADCGVSQSITHVELPDGICDLKLIKQIPSCFPNLSKLFISWPSVPALRSIIHSLSSHGCKLKELYLDIDYDFDAALTTALLDTPYQLTSKKDLDKLATLKRYKYWKGLSKYIGIQLPEDDGNENVANCDDDDEAEGCRAGGLGSLKCLEKLRICFYQKTIRLPKNDVHWREQSKVQYSARGWSRSSSKHIFPLRPLVTEFNKLKPNFKQLELCIYEVIRKIPWDARRFKILTGIKPEIYLIGDSHSLDGFLTQNLKTTTLLVKEEKLKDMNF